MRILSYNTLVAFWADHPETEPSLRHWYEVASAASWSAPDQVRKSFRTAKILGSERIRFEVAGGNYRMIVAFKFTSQIAFIKFIGTHKEYDAIDDVNTVKDH